MYVPGALVLSMGSNENLNGAHLQQVLLKAFHYTQSEYRLTVYGCSVVIYYTF